MPTMPLTEPPTPPANKNNTGIVTQHQKLNFLAPLMTEEVTSVWDEELLINVSAGV